MKKSKLKFDVLDDFPIGITIDDRNNQIIWANKKALFELNLSEKKFKKQFLSEVFDKEDLEKSIKENKEIFETGKPKSDLIQYKNVNNKSNWYKIDKIPIFDSVGNVEEILVISYDITDHINDIQERVNSESKYRNLFESSPFSITIINLEGIILDCNKKTTELLNLQEDEIIGKRIDDLGIFDEIENRRITQYVEALISGKKLSPIETIIKVINSDLTKIVEIYASLLIKENIPYAYQIIARDTTEKRKVEKLMNLQRDFAIELSKKKDLSEILKLFVDTSIKISEMDSGGVNILGSDSDEADYQTGFTNEYISYISKYDPNSKVIKLAKSGKALYWNYDDIKNLNNESFEKEGLRSIAIIPLKLNNSIIGYLNLASHTLNSISEMQKNSLEALTSHIGEIIGRSKIQEQKERLQKEILNNQKLESLGILTGGIAHDFNNFLTIILSNISLAEISIDDPRELINCILESKKAITRAKDLTQQLLTFSKGGAPIKKFANTSVISDLLTETTNFALAGTKIRCDFEIDENLWAVEVDEAQISQVVNNLVINAIQAMPDGGIIKLKAENVIFEQKSDIPLSPGKYIKISLKDQGIGIPKQNLSRIFDPYFTTKETGSGLGLATSYSIIKHHGGHIKADSEIGVGTTFIFYIPASTKKVSPNIAPEINIKTGTGRILIMDDDRSILIISKKVLEKLGYFTETATDGKEALLKYKLAIDEGNKFDLVIMDLTIPGGMGGRELIKELKDIDPDVKAIVSSGYSTDPIIADYKTYGFKAMITKPYHIEEISQIIEKIMNEE